MYISHVRRAEPGPLSRPIVSIRSAFFVRGIWIQIGRHSWLVKI